MFKTEKEFKKKKKRKIYFGRFKEVARGSWRVVEIDATTSCTHDAGWVLFVALSCHPVYMSLHFQERQAERGGKKEDAVTDKLCVLFVFFSTPVLSLSLTYAIEHCKQRGGDGKTKTRTLPAIRRALPPVSRYYEDEYKKRKENEWSH